MIPILNFNGGMKLVSFKKKWVDVVGEVMWSVGSYLGALGDDPLHPFYSFIDFKISLKTRGRLLLQIFNFASQRS